MITLFLGNNSFEIDRALSSVKKSFNGGIEYIDGSQVQIEQLADMLMGISLLSESRLIVIRSLSQNKTVWEKFDNWIPRLSPHIHLVLVEPNLDKRTTAFKALKSSAETKEFSAWDEKNTSDAEKWVVNEAKKMNLDLDAKTARFLVSRVGVDQWALYNSLDLLSLTDKVDIPTIENLIESRPVENVFRLFETALKGDIQRLQDMLRHLSSSDDPHRLFGLLVNQLFQLTALVMSDKSNQEIATDIGIHPYALSQLSTHAKRVKKTGSIRDIISAFAEADDSIKTGSADPWIIIEKALLKVAQI